MSKPYNKHEKRSRRRRQIQRKRDAAKAAKTAA
jgi:hypothetical protein